MPHIKYDPSVMSSLSDVLSITGGRISTIAGDFSDIVSKLDWDVKQDEVSKSISGVKSALEAHITKLKKMHTFIVDAKKSYDNAENGGQAPSSDSEDKDSFKDEVITVAAKTVLEGALDYSKKSGGEWKRLKNFGKAKVNEIKARDIFGITSAIKRPSTAGWGKLPKGASWFTKAKNVKGWGQRFKTNLSKYTADNGLFSNFKAGGKKALYEGAGVALSLGFNLFDNYKEHGKENVGRMVAETVTETAIDFVKDWAIGAAVAAGLAATVGSAPVLAVVAITAGVGMGLDWLTKKITKSDRGFTEAVSDTVLDVGGWALNKAGKFVSSIFKGGS